MEFLIERGVPQRTAHEVIGRLVGLCERRGLKRLSDLSDAELIEAHPKLDSKARIGAGSRKRHQGVSVEWLNGTHGGEEASRGMEPKTRGKAVIRDLVRTKTSDKNAKLT